MGYHMLLPVFLTITYGYAVFGSLTNRPGNDYGYVGWRNITMRCSSTRGSNSITWYLLPVINSVNVTIASGSTVNAEFAQLFRIEQPTASDSNLIIMTVDNSTAGTYTCSDKETFGHAQYMVLLNFFRFTNPSDYLIVGEIVTITCRLVYVENPFFVPIFYLNRVEPYEYIDNTTSPQLEKSNSLMTATGTFYHSTPCTSILSLQSVLTIGQPVGNLLPGSATNGPYLSWIYGFYDVKVLCPSITGAISGATIYFERIITCQANATQPVNYSWTDFTYGNSSIGPQLTIRHSGSYQCTASVNSGGSWKSVKKAIYNLTVEKPSFKAKPLYGPIAGGTKVNFSLEKWSKEVANISVVYFGDFQSTDLQSDSFGNNIVMTTQNATAELIGQPLPIIIELTPGPYNISTNLSFTYQRNPEITGINPSTFVATGGTIVNVTGTNLSSVAYPLIQITLVVDRGAYKNTTNKTGPCEVNAEGNRMACRMPSVDIPDDFLQFLDSMIYNSRATRDTNSMNHLKASNPFILSRRKRYANALNLTLPNGVDTLDIYVGFILDGYHRYDNINDLLPDTQILIFSPPEINFTKNIIEFDPEKDTAISIEGNHMTRGCRLVDYVVKVGAVVCENINLTDNELRCRPPKEQPQSTQNGSFNCDQLLSIYIHLGYRTYQYACIKYPARLPVLIIGLAVGISSFVIVILVIITIVCCCKRSRNRRNKPSEKTPGRRMHAVNEAYDQPSDALPDSNIRSRPSIQSLYGNESYLQPSDLLYAKAMYIRPSDQSYADDAYLRPSAL